MSSSRISASERRGAVCTGAVASCAGVVSREHAPVSTVAVTARLYFKDAELIRWRGPGKRARALDTPAARERSIAVANKAKQFFSLVGTRGSYLGSDASAAARIRIEGLAGIYDLTVHRKGYAPSVQRGIVLPSTDGACLHARTADLTISLAPALSHAEHRYSPSTRFGHPDKAPTPHARRWRSSDLPTSIDDAMSRRESYSVSPSRTKLYVPFHAQLVSVRCATSARARKPRNRPVPPENVTSPRPFTKSRVTWPNATSLRWPG